MRNNYRVIAEKYAKLGKGAVRLTQSSLFLLQDINPTKSNYLFPVLEQDTATGTPKKDEIRLNQNDEFVATGMGIFLVARRYVKDGDVYTLLPGLELFTYPQTEQTIQAATCAPFYGGALKIAVNNIVYLEKWDTKKHQIAPITQIVNSAEGTGVAGAVDSNNFSTDAMYPVQPMVTLSGAKKNEITLNLPESGTGYAFNVTTAANETITYRVSEIGLFLRGYLAQNAAKFQ